MTDTGLTHGRVVALVRLAGVISLLLTGAAVALQFAPLERPPSPSELVTATSRQVQPVSDLFPVFSARLGVRNNPFQFEQMNRAQVQFQPVAQVEETPAPQPGPAAPPPRPQPDIEGLMLVGAVPGSRNAFALFMDEQSGEVQTFALGEKVRNSVLTQVLNDRVELKLADQTAELMLASISDSVPGTAVSQAAPSQSERRAPARQKSRNGKPSLGLSGHMLAAAEAQRIGVTNGLLITGVRRSDGLVQVDDVILKVDGRDFKSTRDVVSMLERKSPGEPMQLTLMRQSKSVNVTIVL